MSLKNPNKQGVFTVLYKYLIGVLECVNDYLEIFHVEVLMDNGLRSFPDSKFPILHYLHHGIIGDLLAY